MPSWATPTAPSAKIAPCPRTNSRAPSSPKPSSPSGATAHQARFRSREHFGALYNVIFTPELNGAQAVVAALLHRHAENRRKRPPDDAPDFLAYGSRFIAMLMGQYLLDELGVTIEQLDHRNFGQARDLLQRKADDYLARAEMQITEALEQLFENRDRTLQRLSVTFRRLDLVDMLLETASRTKA